MKKHQLCKVIIEAESLRRRRKNAETLVFLKVPAQADVITALVALRDEVTTDGDDQEDNELGHDELERLETLEVVARVMRPFEECTGHTQTVFVAGIKIGMVSYSISEAWGD